jgi:indole-3-glycerol phosphate synthase
MAKRAAPVRDLEAQAAQRVHHPFGSALRRPGTRIVAEMKKASPSAGRLREDYRPAEIAALYDRAGAAAVSVLTEPRHFGGSAGHLRTVRRCVELPILRKDFICDPYQVIEAAAWGADVVLLIVAALDPGQLRDLYACARTHRLDVLVESHTPGELELALTLNEAVVGVNSRNLKTLQTDLAVARELAAAIPPGRLAIAESGIRTRADIVDLEAHGYSGFLIGESIIGHPDPAAKLGELLA